MEVVREVDVVVARRWRCRDRRVADEEIYTNNSHEERSDFTSISIDAPIHFHKPHGLSFISTSQHSRCARRFR